MSSRIPTDIDRIADAYTETYLRLSPLTAYALGVGPNDGHLDDLSPEGLAAHSRARRETLGALAAATPVDDVDAVTLDAMTERLGLAEERHAAGLLEASLDVIASPVQEVRDTLDLLPADTDDERALIAAYLRHIPEALTDWHASLAAARARGWRPARRQILGCLAQIHDVTGDHDDEGSLAEIAGGAVGSALEHETRDAVEIARGGYEACATQLRSLLAHASDVDAVGRDVYALASREALGTAIDIDDTYAWGLAEVARIGAAMRDCAATLRPGLDLPATCASLDEDPSYRLEGVDALQRWMQERADAAIDALAGTHFDIPEPVRRIQCRIAPTHTGGIFYTAPSEDFTRPGRMWWSVPRDVTTFATWRELTTVYHEGVPGHHLQIGQTTARTAVLNRWRRSIVWTSGTGEGWALYAEQLMDDLGFLGAADRLGLLDAQMLRAARVVVDIGVHCGMPVPPQWGEGVWSADSAWRFLRAHVALPDSVLRFELDRYLGWPGQAASYKVGENQWLTLRADVAAADGESFSLVDFHRRALDIGSVGLDTLRRAVLAPSAAGAAPRSHTSAGLG